MPIADARWLVSVDDLPVCRGRGRARRAQGPYGYNRPRRFASACEQVLRAGHWPFVHHACRCQAFRGAVSAASKTCMSFPLVGLLPSTDSAAALGPALFACFSGTMGPSDSLETCMSVVRPSAFSDRPPPCGGGFPGSPGFRAKSFHPCTGSSTPRCPQTACLTSSDGKSYKTEAANTEAAFRIIHPQPESRTVQALAGPGRGGAHPRDREPRTGPAADAGTLPTKRLSGRLD